RDRLHARLATHRSHGVRRAARRLQGQPGARGPVREPRGSSEAARRAARRARGRRRSSRRVRAGTRRAGDGSMTLAWSLSSLHDFRLGLWAQGWLVMLVGFWLFCALIGTDHRRFLRRLAGGACFVVGSSLWLGMHYERIGWDIGTFHDLVRDG